MAHPNDPVANQKKLEKANIKIEDIVETSSMPDLEDIKQLHSTSKDSKAVPLDGSKAYKVHTQNKDDKRIDESNDGLPAGTPGHQGFDEDTE